LDQVIRLFRHFGDSCFTLKYHTPGQERDGLPSALRFQTENAIVPAKSMSEELGYFEPRPWHQDRPQRPKVWKREDGAMVWGAPPAPDYLRSRPPMAGH
jgi:hypothetical protein